MALSKCAKCGGTSFEILEVSPEGAVYMFNFIQCAACGAPVGVVPFYNLENEIMETHKLVKRIAQKVGAA
jgi:hypothetical protein